MTMRKIKPRYYSYFFLAAIAIMILLCCTSCNRRITQVITQEKIITHIDTIVVKSLKTDTIPCADFDYSLLNDFHDTIYVKVVDKQIKVKYIKRSDTIYKETIVLLPAPLRVVNRTKIDNSIHTKAKNGSAIGDGNKITTKKIAWWWIFLSGALSWLIIQNVLFRILKTYFPILKFLP